MLYSVVAIVSDPPFLTLVWIVANFTTVFIVTLELLATTWVIAELRTRLHKLKVQRQRQETEMERFEQQTPPIRTRVVTSPSHPAVRQRTRSFRGSDQGSHYWN